MGRLRLGSARFGPARLESARFGSARLGLARPGSTRLGSARPGLARLDPAPARVGSGRLGSAQLGPALAGSARLGSARLGPARLACLCCAQGRACQTRPKQTQRKARVCGAVCALCLNALRTSSIPKSQIYYLQASTGPVAHNPSIQIPSVQNVSTQVWKSQLSQIPAPPPKFKSQRPRCECPSPSIQIPSIHTTAPFL